ncbi:UNVERIFIED_CONTAM: hypothetical protein Sindi_2272900, partial [Sesamum indicum]
MVSQGARADPLANKEEVVEFVEGSVAPTSAGRVEVGREGVGANAPSPPGGALWQDYTRVCTDLSNGLLGPSTSSIAVTCTSARIHSSASTVGPTIHHNYERISKMGATEFEGTLDPEVAKRWWEKVEDVMKLVNYTPENRLKYVVSLFVGNALIWWRSIKRGYDPREITWDEFQKEFDDKYRPKMY